MKIYLFLCALCQFHSSTSTRIKLELKRNILNFGYGINYKYEGMFMHSFGIFYVVTKFMLPSLGDLKFSDINYDVLVHILTMGVLKTQKHENIC